MCQDTLCQTCVSASGGICGSRRAFPCVWAAKWRRTIFYARVGPVRIQHKRARTHYTKLVLLHPVQYAGHVVHSGASRDCNGDAPFFMLRWDRYGFDKKMHHDASRSTCVFASCGTGGSCSAFWCVWDAKQRCTTFHARVGPVRTQQKTCQDTLRRSSVFAYDGIVGSCSAYWCVRRV
jgi:hypothetical protein